MHIYYVEWEFHLAKHSLLIHPKSLSCYKAEDLFTYCFSKDKGGVKNQLQQIIQTLDSIASSILTTLFIVLFIPSNIKGQMSAN